MAGVIFRYFNLNSFQPHSSLGHDGKPYKRSRTHAICANDATEHASEVSECRRFDREKDDRNRKRLDEIEKGLTDLMDHSGMGEPYEEDLESDKDFSDTDKGR
ncbi:hypothetical protein OS493_005460 [Desmophyllum pertusum]|uniref:Uncharacterized protein n=1 Tax=Desmophyllum pertusum TaxID=174260 RepID=A0A9X0CP95_9CNID|nr:hypothetical protein OS493_005460 [Desmophyllum pertusum]